MIGNKYSYIYRERGGCNDMTFAVHHMVGLNPPCNIYSGKLQPISSLMVSLCLKIM